MEVIFQLKSFELFESHIAINPKKCNTTKTRFSFFFHRSNLFTCRHKTSFDYFQREEKNSLHLVVCQTRSRKAQKLSLD